MKSIIIGRVKLLFPVYDKKQNAQKHFERVVLYLPSIVIYQV